MTSNRSLENAAPLRLVFLLKCVCAGLFVLLSVSLSGCFAGRSVGRSLGAGAVESIAKQDSAFVAMERRLIDSAGVFLNEVIETAVLDPARVQMDSMIVTFRGTTDSITLQLAQTVRDELNESIQQLVRENFDLLDERAPLLARNTARALSMELNRLLPGAFSKVGDTLGKQLVAGLTAGLNEVLEPALHRIMLEVTDSLRSRISQVDETVAQSETLGGLRYGLFGGSLVLVLGLGILAFTYSRRQGRALNALIDAIAARGDPELHKHVESCADQAGVHGWLSDRITTRKKSCD